MNGIRVTTVWWIWLVFAGIALSVSWFFYSAVAVFSEQQIKGWFAGLSRQGISIALVILGVLLATAFSAVAAYRYLGARAAGTQYGAENGIALARNTRPGSAMEEFVELNYGLLRTMEWRRFEIVCAEYLRAMGYEVIETG